MQLRTRFGLAAMCIPVPCSFSSFIAGFATQLQVFVLLLAPWLRCSRCAFLMEDLFGLDIRFTGVYATCPAPIDLLELLL